MWAERDPDRALKEMLDRLLSQLSRRLFPHIDISAAIIIYNDRSRRLEVGSGCGPLAGHIHDNPPRPEGVSTHVFRTGTPVWADSLADWPPDVPVLRPSVRNENLVASFAMVPLLVGQGEGQEPIGLLTISAPVSVHFDQERRSALDLFARQSAIAVQAARVQRRRLREQLALERISRASIAGSPQDVAKTIAREAVELTLAHYAVVFAFDRGRAVLQSQGLYVGEDDALAGTSVNLDMEQSSINLHVVETGAAYYAPDLRADSHFQHIGPLDDRAQSAYCVPLILRGLVLGTLYVTSVQPHGFSAADRRFVEQLAPYAANAFETAAQRNALVEFQQAISDLLPLSSQLVQIREQLERLGYDTRGLIVALYDPETQVVHFPKVRDRGELVADEDVRKRPGAIYGPRRLGTARGIAERIIESGEGWLYAAATPQPDDAIDPVLLQDVTAAVALPMRRAERVVGMLCLRHYDVRFGAYTDADRLFLELIANHIAIVIDNSTWLGREVSLNAQLEQLRRFQVNVADVLSLDHQVRQIRKELQKAGFDTAGLFIATYDEETQLIQLPKVYERGELIPEEKKRPGMLLGPRRLNERRGLVDWLLTHRRPIHVQDFEHWVHVREIEPVFRAGVKSCLATPIFHADRLVGAIGLRGYDRDQTFTDQQRDYLAQTARIIGIVLENSRAADRRQQELRQRLRELEALTDFQRRISAVESEAAEINNIYREIRATMQGVGFSTDDMYIALYRDDSQIIEFPLVRERGREIRAEETERYRKRRLGERSDLVDWIVQSRESLLLRDSTEIATWAEEHPEMVKPVRSRCWMGAPMVSPTDDVIGVISIRHFRNERVFTEHHLALLASIARQAAVVLENARLLASEQGRARRAEALAKATREILKTAVTVDQVLQMILAAAVRATGAVIGTVRVVERSALFLRETWPADLREQNERLQPVLPLHGRGIVARAVRRNKYELVHNVHLDDEYLPIHDCTRSELAVVIRSDGLDRGDPVGVINLEHPEADGLVKKHADLLIGMADLAAIAIQNIKRYEQLVEVREEVLALERVALFGIAGAELQHSLTQKTASLRYALHTLKRWMEDSAIDDAVVARAVANIQAATDSIQSVNIIERNPNLAVDETTRLDSFLADVIESWCRAYNAEADADIHFSFNGRCGRNLSVSIPADMLRIAVEKLISNALRAMGSSGRLTVTTRLESHQARVDIVDSGAGIPDRVRQHYLRTSIPANVHADGAAAGTGTGGIIAAFIMRRYRGSIKIVRTGTSGTHIRLDIPTVTKDS